MEPLQPDFPWQSRQDINALPEAHLIHAIILSAWQDANKRFNCRIRREAREWFNSNQFQDFCEYLGISSDDIRKHGIQCWREKDEAEV